MIEFSRKSLLSHTPDPSTEYDVMVAGGGPAAIGAAVGAARTGAMTAIFEKPKKWERESYVDLHRHSTIADGNLNVHPEHLCLALFEIFDEAGIHYSLYSPVTGVLKEGDTVTGVEILGREGVISYRSRMVVDATGDGDVAWLAGCEMTEGREYDGRHMPMTLLFTLANVDEERLFEYLDRVDWRGELAKERERGELTITTFYGFSRTTIPGMVTVNNGGSADIELDAAKTRDLTAMERLGNEIAVDFVEFARTRKIPGLEECHLARTGAYVAPRDFRRLVEENGIDYRFYSPVIGITMEGKVVTGIEVAGKEGLAAFRGAVVVDATGEGDVAHLAGCEMTEGREEDGKDMPMTLVFALACAEVQEFISYYYEKGGCGDLRKLMDEERGRGRYLLTSWYGFDRTTVPGVLSVNNGGCADLRLDGNKTAHLTAMERLASSRQPNSSGSFVRRRSPDSKMHASCAPAPMRRYETPAACGASTSLRRAT